MEGRCVCLFFWIKKENWKTEPGLSGLCRGRGRGAGLQPLRAGWGPSACSFGVMLPMEGHLQELISWIWDQGSTTTISNCLHPILLL